MHPDDADLTPDQQAHNERVRAACLRQLKDKQISRADYDWLTGARSEKPKYLMKRNFKGVVHLWVDGDTLCRAVAGGALRRSDYRVETKNFGGRICLNCQGAQR